MSRECQTTDHSDMRENSSLLSGVEAADVDLPMPRVLQTRAALQHCYHKK